VAIAVPFYNYDVGATARNLIALTSPAPVVLTAGAGQIRSLEVKNVIAAYYGSIDRLEQFTENRREIQRARGYFVPELLELEQLRALARENQGGPPWAPEELIVSETDRSAMVGFAG